MHNLSGVTILLSLTVFSQVVTESMPRTSDANPLLGKNHRSQKNVELTIKFILY